MPLMLPWIQRDIPTTAEISTQPGHEPRNHSTDAVSRGLGGQQQQQQKKKYTILGFGIHAQLSVT